MSDEDAERLDAGQAAFLSEVAAVEKVARAAIAAGDVAKAVEAVVERSSLANSEERLGVILDLCEGAPAIFAEVFKQEWSACDATWPLRNRLLRALRRSPLRVEGQFTVYRGCSHARVRGVSWSTDKQVASGFARGHRGISVPDPVIASAEIDGAFWRFGDERAEHEVVLDPRRLQKLRIAPVGDAVDLTRRRPRLR